MQIPPLDLPHRTPACSATCCHKRLVDPVLAENGKETGTVRCLECGAIIPDPLPAPVQ